jgi:hypothetical protein
MPRTGDEARQSGTYANIDIGWFSDHLDGPAKT